MTRFYKTEKKQHQCTAINNKEQYMPYVPKLPKYSSTSIHPDSTANHIGMYKNCFIPSCQHQNEHILLKLQNGNCFCRLPTTGNLQKHTKYASNQIKNQLFAKIASFFSESIKFPSMSTLQLAKFSKMNRNYTYTLQLSF